MRNLFIIALGLVAVGSLVYGCNGGGDDHGPMQGLTSDQQAQKQIETIEKNDKMPQFAKDQAIGAIRAHMAGGGAPAGKK